MEKTVKVNLVELEHIRMIEINWTLCIHQNIVGQNGLSDKW